jgi:hypothetical protein
MIVMRKLHLLLFPVVGLLATGCSSDGGSQQTPAPVAEENVAAEDEPDVAAEDGPDAAVEDEPDAAATTPKDAIARQLELLRAGDVEGLKACFTDRLQESITAEAVEGAKAQAEEATVDELVAEVEFGEIQGQKTAKIKTKNGRTLTTLIEVDGTYVADTVWFE